MISTRKYRNDPETRARMLTARARSKAHQIGLKAAAAHADGNYPLAHALYAIEDGMLDRTPDIRRMGRELAWKYGNAKPAGDDTAHGALPSWVCASDFM
jgi:hypothetical protein